ncbi:5-hydroxytryptamine receptor 4 [Stylophora pistillata]|uniref:5-hydroxytryptamine receptor 4 n=1 Tax=Stylophora pistillata TaxID=50429 RepID=A0A2B4ST01_STYPI|nr:5-hydroxytryptamine receptor 4 [Stylophora pistillata]
MQGNLSNVSSDILDADVQFDGELIFLVFVLLLILATVAGNGFVFMAVYTFRELRTVTNYFIVALAAADVAVALLAMPVWLVRSLVHVEKEQDEYVIELCTQWIDPFCCTASIVNATAAIHQISKMHSTRLSSTSYDQDRKQSFERRKRFFRELKITKMLAVIVSLFVICWSPFLVVTLIEAFTTKEIPIAVQGVIVFLPYVLSCANPWIYTGMNRDFRLAFKKLFCTSKILCLKRSREGNANERMLRPLPSTTVDETFISNGLRQGSNSIRKISNRGPEIFITAV